MADSGTLLVCCLDRSDTLNRLREDLRSAFPAAPAKQTSIMHITVLRLLTPKSLDADTVDKLQQLCAAWTQRLKGRTFPVNTLW